MVWIPRQLGANLCYHVRVQCNYKAFYFKEDGDFRRYLEILWETKEKLHFFIHHYVVMSTHVHLILTTPGPILLDRVMQVLNHRYAMDYHRRHMKRGHFWMGGYKASVINTDSYGLTCMRYLDRNPVRAGMVSTPDQWPWSAHTYYSLGTSDYLIDPHPSYLGLAKEGYFRRALYRQFVNALMPADEERERQLMKTLHRRYGKIPTG